MTIKLNLRLPTTAYGYAELEIEGETREAVERDLASMQRTLGASIQLTGGGDSATAAERLLKEELGATRINEDGSPWDTPTPPVQQAWGETSFGPPVESPGPAPFGPGASAPASPGFGPGAGSARDDFLIEVPREKMDTWKNTDRPWLQAELPKGFVGWDGDAKRNTIKKSAGDQYLNWLRTNGYTLR